jgi:uncharacterized damage-inducible protein DinB
MELLDHLERMFTWDDWANRETLANLRVAPTPSARSLRLLSHVVACELLWLARLEKTAPPCPVWPAFTFEECAAHIRELPRIWQDYFSDLGSADLGRRVAYVNSKGAAWENSILDILTHVVLHGAHHRGQIAADVRAGGRDPAYTDYIECVRTGRIEAPECGAAEI